MSVLITGGTGLLGKALIETRAQGVEIVATYIGEYEIDSEESEVVYRKIDVMDYRGNAALFEEFRPQAVIHTASIGSPDFAERNKAITWSINVTGTSYIIDLCNRFSAKFIYVSSNGIYDGDHAPYGEDAIPKPVHYYGKTKLEGETLSRLLSKDYVIFRPILMYGWNHRYERPNIVTTLIEKLRDGEEMRIFDDVYANPLYSIQCAHALWEIIAEDKNGDFNVAGADRVSVYELALSVAEVFCLDKRLIRPAREGSLPGLAKRPRDTSYRTEKMERILGLKPMKLEEGLKLMKVAEEGRH